MSSPFPLDDQGLPVGYRFRPDWELTPRQVQSLRQGGDMGGGPVVLIDCRTEQEFAIAAIEGATFIPLHEAGQRLPELKALADRRIIVYCHHGMRSLQLTSFLRHQGCADVFSMAGGIDLWAMDIEPGMARY